MEWYRMVWSRFGEFEGRSRRTEYWMFSLINFLALLALGALGGVGLIVNRDYGAVLFLPMALYLLAALIPGIAVSVRRLHDSGKSGWLLLLFAVIGIIPFVGFIASIVQIVLMCQDSEPGTNQYGPNPKFPQGTGMEPVFAGIPQFNFNAQPGSFAGAGSAAPSNPGASSPRFCTGCGTALPEGAGFCGGCGRPA
jgi:uncharacterized membrane protein YhaH (DUF805 family)